MLFEAMDRLDGPGLVLMLKTSLPYVLVAIVTIAAGHWILAEPARPEGLALDTVTSRLKAEEGFRALPYRDSEGVLTIGYGTNLEIGITKREGAYLLSERVSITKIRFSHEWKPYRDMPADVQVELIDMAYQLGVSGLLGFHDMLKNLALGNYEGAALEVLDSAWATETPSRAARAAEVFRSQ